MVDGVEIEVSWKVVALTKFKLRCCNFKIKKN